jgi:protein gp37
MIKQIALTDLYPHPKNPRLTARDDVVEQIAAQINGAMDEAHALIVRPKAKGFEVISGHTRALAAKKVGLASVPCWVREMSDADAYMALVLNNAQGELSPLEIGLHQLGSGMTIRDYASKIGMNEDTLAVRVHAGKIVRHVSDSWSSAFDGTPEAQMEALDGLHGEFGNDHFRHLAEIHAAPEWVWVALVEALKANEWSVDLTRKAVKHVGKLKDIPLWANRSEIASRLIDGAAEPNDIAKFAVAFDRANTALDAAELEAAALKAELLAELEKALPIKLSEVSAVCIRVLGKQADLIQAKKQAEIDAQRKTEEMAERVQRWRKFVTIDEWNGMDAATRMAVLSSHDTSNFNEQKGPDIEWAQWSWNPITGCLHDCPYCYARDIAHQERMAKVYPYGFEPTLHPPRLTAPQSMKVPSEATTDTRFKNVFTGSMSDIFGRWVPTEWIEAILVQVRQAKQWNFLFLTKFPNRMAEFDFPPNAWVGTSVDLQARIPAAEKAFAKINAKVKWISVEPMLEPLKFKQLDLFNWIVVGGASSSTKTPEWRPPAAWVFDLRAQAEAVGIPFYAKHNLLGSTCREGMLNLPFKAPVPDEKAILPDVFDYLSKRAKGLAAA